jgi:hypothetical protein
MIELTESDIDATLRKDKLERGLRKYCWIQDNLYKNDVTTAREFQKKYNGFYRVRQRSPEWYAVYYRLMEHAKISEPTFQRILSELRRRTGRLEASFASKLVATLRPDCPVMDSVILKRFGLRRPRQKEADREAKEVRVYDTLASKYMSFLSQPIARAICERFTARYPWADVTDLKKVDLVLWQTRTT